MKDMFMNEHLVVFSHPLCATRFDTVLKYFFSEKHIKAKCIPQIFASLSISLLTYPAVIIESGICKVKTNNVKVEAPVFVIGHWRSGTTLVQYMLSRDKRFGIFDPYITYGYNYYHTLKHLNKYIVKNSMAEKRPMDNMKFGMDLPLEEYIVFATSCADSVYAGNFFPHSFEKYLNNAYWKDLPEKKYKKIAGHYDGMLKKASLINNGKRMLLKSPDNTCRVEELHKLYPDAKFVSIYRNPYTVIRSSVHLYETIFSLWGLQNPPSRSELEDMIIDNFIRMYNAYAIAKAKLPEDSIYEIRYEDFQEAPIPILKDAYEKLGLGDFEKARHSIEEYWNSEADYKKNKFDYPADLMKKIDDNLGFYFEEYGYEKGKIFA